MLTSPWTFLQLPLNANTWLCGCESSFPTLSPSRSLKEKKENILIIRFLRGPHNLHEYPAVRGFPFHFPSIAMPQFRGLPQCFNWSHSRFPAYTNSYSLFLSNCNILDLAGKGILGLLLLLLLLLLL